MITVNKRKVSSCILLSIITFGIYCIYWQYLLVKNTKAIKKDDSKCTKEMLCLIFIPFYSIYWWFTRGKAVKDGFAENGYSSAGNETAYLILQLFGLGIIAMAIMQNDFNSLPEQFAKSQQNSRKSTRYLTEGAMVAAIYVVLTWLSSIFGLARGVIQFPLSESLYAVAIFSPAAVLGVFVGCILSNILFGLGLYDIIFGSLATLIGAFFTYKLRKRPYLALIPPILSNTIIIPFVLRFTGASDDALWFLGGTIFIGEFVTCGILGAMLYQAIKKTNIFHL